MNFNATDSDSFRVPCDSSNPLVFIHRWNADGSPALFGRGWSVILGNNDFRVCVAAVIDDYGNLVMVKK